MGGGIMIGNSPELRKERLKDYLDAAFRYVQSQEIARHSSRSLEQGIEGYELVAPGKLTKTDLRAYVGDLLTDTSKRGAIEKFAGLICEEFASRGEREDVLRELHSPAGDGEAKSLLKLLEESIREKS